MSTVVIDTIPSKHFREPSYSGEILATRSRRLGQEGRDAAMRAGIEADD
jgi:hypothetical protein